MDWKSLGLSESQCNRLSSWNTSENAGENWSQFCQLLRGDFPAPSQARHVWEEIFSGADLRPMWTPLEADLAASSALRWAKELQLDGFQALHCYSVENRPEFWQAAVDKLTIQFDQRGETILTDPDPREATWFPGAKLNIANSCFQADEQEPAVIFQRPGQELRTWTYGDLSRRAARVANSLQHSGFRTGDAIAVVLPMTAESVAIYLGIVMAGMVVVSIADSFAANEITNRLQIANAKAVFTYDEMLRAGKTIELSPRVQQATELPIITLSLQSVQPPSLRNQDFNYETWLVEEDRFEPVVCPASAATNILFSSGTTGDPKAIPWTHLTPIKCAMDGFCHQEITYGTVAAWPTNLGWMMGPWLIYATLINRGTIALYEDVPMGPGFGKFVEDAKINMLGVVPTIVRSWRQQQTMESFDWSSVRCFSSTGEASQADDMFYLSALAEMKPVIEYCGGTEIGGGYITSTLVQPNIPSTFSTPAIGLDLVILDSEDQPSDEGEVFLIGPSIGLSETLLNRDHGKTYYEGLPRLDSAGILRKHGDFLRRLPGGYFVAGGRADDTMNLGGIKVSSAEIERVLNCLPEIRETAAVATAEGGPQRLIIFAVLETGQHGKVAIHALQQEMNRKLKQDLNPLFKVTEIRLIDHLPRTASNKVMRRKLRSQLDDGSGTAITS